MRRAPQTFMLKTPGENSDFCGVKLLSHACIEHELSIVNLQQKLGIFPSINVRDMKSSKAPQENYFEIHNGITLLAIGVANLPIEEIFKNENEELFLKEEELVTSAWDQDSFAVLTSNRDIAVLLKALYDAIIGNDAVIYRSSKEDLMAGPLIVGIHSVMRASSETSTKA